MHLTFNCDLIPFSFQDFETYCVRFNKPIDISMSIPINFFQLPLNILNEYITCITGQASDNILGITLFFLFANWMNSLDTL